MTLVYDKKSILGLKFRHTTQLRKLSRHELFSRLQLIRTVDPITNSAYKKIEENSWRKNLDSSPHGFPWHTSYHACLTGDTEIVTRHGIKPICDLVGEAELLIQRDVENDGDSRSGRGQKTRVYRSGRFEVVPVRSFGEHEVLDVHLRRGRQTKTVRATAKHCWQLKDTSIAETSELQSGDKLKSIKSHAGLCKMVPFAVAQGFVFGDGTARRSRRDVAWIDIHHNGKDEAMLSFFHGHNERYFRREGRLAVTQIQNIPRTWKKIPDMDESGPFLLSWLAGYFAADGTVSKAGQAVLTSASREAIDCVRGILSICGISYGHVGVNTQSGTYPQGKKYVGRIVYYLSINVRDLPDWFFLLPKHAARARDRLTKTLGRQHDWEVVYVSEAGHIEEVFCPTTPTGFFALSDELLTGNSQFPGDDPMACSRQALYRMMDFPSAEPFSRRGRQFIAAGKAIELELVRVWHEAGILISAPADEEIQTGFEFPDAWLTGSVDAVLLPDGWTKPLPVEIKAKLDKNVRRMQLGMCGPDSQHINQIKVQLALIRLNQEETWPDLDPVTHGYIYYLSLDDPAKINAEFRVDLDTRFFEKGVARLKEWRALFLKGELPVVNPSKKHPFGWRWSYQPCVYCPFKRTCQLDFQQGNTRLSESVGIDRAKLVRESYSPTEALDRVEDRWKSAKIVWRDDLSERSRASGRFRNRRQA